MKICIIAEGSYPYVVGGVSSWIQSLISSMKEHEFVIYAIGAEKKDRGKFVYDMPENLLEIKEVFIDDFLDSKGKYGTKLKINENAKTSFYNLIIGNKTDFQPIFTFIKKLGYKDIGNFFMSKELFDIITKAYEENFEFIPFTEFFWNVRSMLLPIFYIIKSDIPKADIYHSVSTGYAGVVGSLAKDMYNVPYLLTEHGIYTREREEEIIKSTWVKGVFKDIWIKFFYNLSYTAYSSADNVITLFNRNKEVEIELGCKEEKITVIPNGVNVNDFLNIPKKPFNDDYINIGAVVRIVPIKDIKTMIQSFALVKEEIPNSKFYIMGPIEENKDYYEECIELVDSLEVQDVIFTGKVNIKEYVGKMDILVLSSISEGQPLAILEGMAMSKPFVATNVGSCKELLYGSNDGIGRSGYIVQSMNYEDMASNIVRLSKDYELRKSMGHNAFERVSKHYTLEYFIDRYKDLYKNMKR